MVSNSATALVRAWRSSCFFAIADGLRQMPLPHAGRTVGSCSREGICVALVGCGALSAPRDCLAQGPSGRRAGRTALVLDTELLAELPGRLLPAMALRILVIGRLVGVVVAVAGGIVALEHRLDAIERLGMAGHALGMMRGCGFEKRFRRGGDAASRLRLWRRRRDVMDRAVLRILHEALFVLRAAARTGRDVLPGDRFVALADAEGLLVMLDDALRLGAGAVGDVGLRQARGRRADPALDGLQRAVDDVCERLLVGAAQLGRARVVDQEALPRDLRIEIVAAGVLEDRGRGRGAVPGVGLVERQIARRADLPV